MIWLLRHGDAAEGSPDAERELTDKGREQARVAVDQVHRQYRRDLVPLRQLPDVWSGSRRRA